MKAVQAAGAAEPTARTAALRDLVQTAHEDVATEALVILTRLGAGDVDTLAVALIPDLSDVNMRRVLGEAGGTRDIHFRTECARVVLNRIASDQGQAAHLKYEEGGQGTAGLAAMLLVDGGKADRDLIAKVARMRPNDSGLWLALAKVGISNTEDLSLAISVMREPKAPRWARLAAAALLAPADATAREYLNNALISFLRSFGQTPVEMILVEGMQQPPQGPDLAKWAEFQPGLRMIGILEFMQTPDAEQITFEFLNSPNLWVRTALALVAAMRWPEHFLRSAPMPSVEERSKLLAALSIFHPELLSRVQSIAPEEETMKIRSKMMRQGVATVFYLPWNAGLVF